MRPASRSSRTSAVSLWCVFMTSAAPPTDAWLDADSMRSGRRVPCARNTCAGSRPKPRSSSSATRTNVSPMILRFHSGFRVALSSSVSTPFTVVRP